MDYIRQPYYCNMRTKKTPEEVIRVMWYMLPPGQPDGPQYTAFRSCQMLPLHNDYGEVGQVDLPPFDGATSTVPSPLPAGAFSGTDDQWLHGV